ncbi:5485_t:CDS:1, partial [Acaulospora colombiana]
AVSPSVSSPTGSFSSIFAPPSQPPPTRVNSTQQQPIYAPPPTLPPRRPRTEDLAQSMQTLSVNPIVSPPPSTNETVQTPEVEKQAIQRYTEFLRSHRSTLSGVNLDSGSAKAFYASLVTFMDTEKEFWRAQLDIPLETAPPVTVNTVSRETVTVQPTQPVAAAVPTPAP